MSRMVKRAEGCEDEILHFRVREVELMYELNKTKELNLKVELAMHFYMKEIGSPKRFEAEKLNGNENIFWACKWVDRLVILLVVFVFAIILSVMSHENVQNRKCLL